jgi:hypothetical protein
MRSTRTKFPEFGTTAGEKKMRKLIYTAVALALSPGAYAADLTSTQSASISSISIPSFYDGNEGSTPAEQTATRSLAFGRFNANTGVLTGVSSALTFTGGSMTLSASGTRGSGFSTPSFSSSGSVAASTNLTGLSPFSAINQTLTNSCSGTSGCFPNGSGSNLSSTSSLTKTDNTWLSPTATVGAGSLNNYVGTGSVSSTLTTTATVNLSEETRIDNQRAYLSLTGLTGSQSLTYSYLKHANASFSNAADANSLLLGGLTAAPLAFSIFNLGDLSTTKLDFISLQCTGGDCGAFGVTMPSFQNLVAGGSADGSATLLAGDVGNYSATYLFTFKDDDAIGATTSHLTNTLSLSIEGSIAPVPEPSSWALLSLGLIGLAWRARKK